MTYPIIKLPDGLIAVSHEKGTLLNGIACVDKYSREIGYMNFPNAISGDQWLVIVAASKSLNLGVVELPDNWKEQLLTYPASVEIEGGNFRAYNFD